MHSVEIAQGVYWVGYVDWDVRDFHGYQTHRGSSYNAYLIVDEKIVLIDSVKRGHGDELLRKVSERVDPSQIDYVISNHAEPDHSGELAEVLQRARGARLVASEKGKATLSRYYPGQYNWHPVKTGDSLSLGRYTLKFINTPMLHWPDSMFTYVPEAKLLFSMDAFGQHLASNLRFDRDIDADVLLAEAKTYYANIIMPFGRVVSRTLAQAAELDIEMICPSHGAIWTTLRDRILDLYSDWSQCKSAGKMVLVYDTMWESTEQMADAITEGATDEGLSVKQLRLGRTDLTEMMAEVLDAAVVVVGTPTLNNHMMPNVAGFLTYMKGLRPAGKMAFAFGSHGWSGGGVAEVSAALKETGFELISDDIVCQYRPDAEVLRQCREAGRLAAQKVVTQSA